MTAKPHKTRFCPSPTGHIHIGNARTALFNYLYARHSEGVFLFRIEDSDRERSKLEYTEQMIVDLKWLGLDWQEGVVVEGDNGPYCQSQREAIYEAYYQQLIEQGLAYPCFCSEQALALSRKLQRSQGKAPRYAGTCAHLAKKAVDAKIASGLKPALRFRVADDVVIEFTDLVRGPQSFFGKDIGDFIIKRSSGASSFMFNNAIDDAMMKVTHAFRGEDHLTNTPRQIMILKALKLKPPTYGHISLITAMDGSGLSKRLGSKSIMQLRDEGYLPSAIVNYLARLGHTYKEAGWLSDDALAAAFNLKALNKASAKYNPAQLDHYQKLAIAKLDAMQFRDWLGDAILANVPSDKQADFCALMQANILFPVDALNWASILFSENALEIHAEQVAVLKAADNAFYKTVITALNNNDVLADIMQQLKAKLEIKGKQLFQPLRIALTGQLHGPELKAIFNLMPNEIRVLRFKQAQIEVDS